eukprot:GILK01006117.1.p1 GENE.GILK01006117.1~~GILK01006117.1.p1  ORF type:complete len:421 (-),score=34.93 GILK01006117.1:280-1542(-)
MYIGPWQELKLHKILRDFAKTGSVSSSSATNSNLQSRSGQKGVRSDAGDFDTVQTSVSSFRSSASTAASSSQRLDQLASKWSEQIATVADDRVRRTKQKSKGVNESQRPPSGERQSAKRKSRKRRVQPENAKDLAKHRIDKMRTMYGLDGDAQVRTDTRDPPPSSSRGRLASPPRTAQAQGRTSAPLFDMSRYTSILNSGGDASASGIPPQSPSGAGSGLSHVFSTEHLQRVMIQNGYGPGGLLPTNSLYNQAVVQLSTMSHSSSSGLPAIVQRPVPLGTGIQASTDEGVLAVALDDMRTRKPSQPAGSFVNFPAIDSPTRRAEHPIPSPTSSSIQPLPPLSNRNVPFSSVNLKHDSRQPIRTSQEQSVDQSKRHMSVDTKGPSLELSGDDWENEVEELLNWTQTLPDSLTPRYLAEAVS